MSRRRGDPQPTDVCAVLLASTGKPFSAEALRRAAELAGGGRVAVLNIARIHGYALGIPNPGLLPTKREKQEALAVVSGAVAKLERRGLEVDGQVAIARNAAKTIARIAVLRGATAVVMDDSGQSRARRFLEGDPVSGVRRRVGRALAVESITAPT